MGSLDNEFLCDSEIYNMPVLNRFTEYSGKSKVWKHFWRSDSIRFGLIYYAKAECQVELLNGGKCGAKLCMKGAGTRQLVMHLHWAHHIHLPDDPPVPIDSNLPKELTAKSLETVFAWLAGYERLPIHKIGSSPIIAGMIEAYLGKHKPNSTPQLKLQKRILTVESDRTCKKN